MAALVWLVLGVVLIGAEVLSGDLVLLMLGVGGLAAAGAASLDGGYVAQVLVFGVVSIGLLVLARPALKRRFLSGPAVKTNVEALVGAKAVVLSTVDEHGGRIKINGEEWSARSLGAGHSIDAGATVTVVEISGATAMVSDQP